MTRILIFRFSAMGDVVMLLPVVKGLLDANTDVEVYLLTQKMFFPFFESIDRLFLLEIDLKSEHRKIGGLFKRFLQLKRQVNPSLVIDLHCVIRSTILDSFFFLFGYKIFRFDKGTFDKSAIVRSKRLVQLASGSQRYADVFKRAGFDCQLPGGVLFSGRGLTRSLDKIFTRQFIIGIAPFAKHKQKIWGIDKICELIGRLNGIYSCDILLFGGGSREIDELKIVASNFCNCVVSADHFKLGEEIQVVQQLELMISMDSANMHIAAMAGIPTVSIWGATHSALGFAPYGQPIENIIQYNGDELLCRPCSVYGAKPCKYGNDIRCMNYIPVNDVFDRVCAVLESKNIKPIGLVN